MTMQKNYKRPTIITAVGANRATAYICKFNITVLNNMSLQWVYMKYN